MTRRRSVATSYGFAVSDKRYVLFNLHDGRPVIRKASAHGLGHLRAPYGPNDAPSDIPAPDLDLRDIGVERWQQFLRSSGQYLKADLFRPHFEFWLRGRRLGGNRRRRA